MKRAVNATLQRLTGYQLRKAGAPVRRQPPASGSRLLTRPAFVLCTVRSGSTLLRMLLDSHSQIHAPHEVHLRDFGVEVRSKYAERSLAEMRLDREELEHVLWDWMLHQELARAGKRLLVNKTPSDVFIADRLLECWPDARFIFLLRHPLAIARSRHELRPQDSAERNHEMVLRYADALEAARAKHPGLTVRYEELAADPARVTRELCAFLGVEWEERMLDYGRFEHGNLRAGLGDWKDRIRAGKVLPPAPLPAPDEVPADLRPIAAAWGYLPTSAPSRTGTSGTRS
ncbi:MAG TPA: sulfotransferase [Solirubrobacteraceae bacterium]|nr:sulfotransferase [Solirubrobacteraceae bacterium]